MFEGGPWRGWLAGASTQGDRGCREESWIGGSDEGLQCRPTSAATRPWRGLHLGAAAPMLGFHSPMMRHHRVRLCRPRPRPGGAGPWPPWDAKRMGRNLRRCPLVVIRWSGSDGTVVLCSSDDGSFLPIRDHHKGR
ncbi:hypothetical protein V6N12_042516 [Hibiscus sabdariffa]|uniref:Uncharacterized protein n=1 Tax=Hibiscus sabdariffa TaxID=183260 RepID=A0ABR2EF05_9ROSI